MACSGITATAPIGLPIKPKLLPPKSPPQGPKALVQLEPIGQAGGAPTSHSKRTHSLSADNSTPVKPEPEMPPERVKIVTVLPMLSHRDSKRQFPQKSIMVFPPYRIFNSLFVDRLLVHTMYKEKKGYRGILRRVAGLFFANFFTIFSYIEKSKFIIAFCLWL
jgi:hypothetical protein